MSTLGLMMIVKDEAHVVERCLSSVRDHVDWWVVADTGSTDGTQDVVRRALAGVPGELVERPWIDFGHNRQEVLDLARTRAASTSDAYALWIDADEQLLDAPAPPSPGLDLDGYHLTVEYAGTRYARLAVVRLERPWRWVGPIHEYLELPGASLGTLASPRVLVEHAGARSRDPETYRNDIAVIERALRGEPGQPRLQFYLAQSLKDAGELEQAVAAYRVRIANPAGWDQERWVSRYQVARLLERLERPAAEVAEAYLDAYQHCSWRAEPLVELARLERTRGRFAVALLYARQAVGLADPGGAGLFVESGSYTWRGWDELAVSAYWCGRYAEGLAAARRALAVRPDDPRLQANVAFCEQGVGRAAVTAAVVDPSA